MKRAVVTGANGFVGKAVVKELLSQGVDVLSIVHRKGDNPEEFAGSDVLECDLSNYNSILTDVSEFKPDVFYHFAWNGSAGPARGDERIQLTNIQGTCDAVRLAAGSGCRKFVFAASIMEYEVEKQVKAMGSPGITAIYSSAKLTADYMARIIANDVGIGYISALISNIYGPGEKSPRLVNYSIRKLLKGERLSLTPCTQLYDFIYISDAARMFVGIGNSGLTGRTYYIGNRRPKQLKFFMEELRDVVSPGTELGIGDIPFGGESLTYQEFDTEKLYTEIGIETEISFAEGIRRTRDWISEENRHE